MSIMTSEWSLYDESVSEDIMMKEVGTKSLKTLCTKVRIVFIIRLLVEWPCI